MSTYITIKFAMLDLTSQSTPPKKKLGISVLVL